MNTHYIIMDDPDEASPAFEDFEGIQVLRPGHIAEILLRSDAEKHFRARYAPGVVRGKENVNEVYRHHFAFYADTLNRVLPPIASRDFIELLLGQYDRSVEIDLLAKRGQLSPERDTRWQHLGPVLRRALKYLSERVVMLGPTSRPSRDSDILRNAETALICAEQLTRLYIESDRVYFLPGETAIEILPEGESDIFRNAGEDVYGTKMLPRIVRDRQHREEFMTLAPPQMLPAEQETHMAEAFRQTMGISLLEALSVIRQTIDRAVPHPRGFNTLFFRKQMIIDGISKASGYPAKSVQQALDGFTVTKDGMASEGREIFRPKQEYRAFRRAFFEMPHETGTHLAWSKKMAIESYIHLGFGMAYGQFPREWMSPGVRAAGGRLSNARGKWFESVVASNFGEVGIIGVASARDQVGRGTAALRIPQDVGELDFLGVSPRDGAVIVAECKCVQGSYEPNTDRDDIKDFITSDDAYMKKLAKKAEWVFDNIDSVCSALSSVIGELPQTDLKRVHSIMVTYYPSPAALFWDKTPCVSLTEFMLDYQEKGAWPYTKGILAKT